ncbi:MAG: dihydroorotase [Proteobacteria bacterium]|nr:dihydroorotase [Pseudomonadota bacterium]MDA1355209.1 dihydroorotase [Pseudomonadota bacterium]
MTDKRTAYINARLLDPESGLDALGGLLTEGAHITDLGPGLFADGVPEGIETVDCGGHCLSPGLVDMHVHLREPGHEHKETIATGSQSALAGGVTSLCCMPNTDPVIDNVGLIEFIHRRAREAKGAKVFPFAAVTKGLGGKQLTEFGMLAEAGAVAFTDDGLPISDSQVMRRALSYAKTFDLLISQHAEDLSLSSCGCMAEGEVATRLGLDGIPEISETVMVERDIRLVEHTDGRYHVAHISTADAVDCVRRAKARGLRVTCEAAPHHFSLTDLDVGDYRTFAKMAPPLRSETNRAAIVEGLKDGTIDAIATDHAPHDQESKRLPMAHAANGIVGLETLLPLSLELYHGGHMPLLELLRRLTLAPADLLKLPVGRLRKGAPADLLLFDLEAPWVVDSTKFRSMSKNTPFDGRPVQGRALRTIVDGRTLFTAET